MLSRRNCLHSSLAIGCAALLKSPLRAAPPVSPWRNLFNGRNLDGWSVFQQGENSPDQHGAVAIEQGILHFLGPRYAGPDTATFGHIATLETHGNYHLRLEYRWGERRFAPRTLQRRNSGLLYHMAPERDRLFPDCVEFQIEEDDVGDAIMVNTKALQGPLLGGTPLWPKYLPFLPRTYEEPTQAGGIARQWFRHAGAYERLDGWNTLDLYAFGDQAAHLVNGRIVNTLFGMIARDGAPLGKGRIALEFEAAEVFFRNIAIRDLTPTEIAAIMAGQ
ncbi:3-keto-disaccharide hydrolase [Novosphingobium sp. KACC 22771]|uniref:3-keto-disaccharide hydrolase n=1 Tax=Novosphingobium sp. KACC 22771 TaxID=3025670 RepID=UPI002365AC3A|nr:DUF1080 domain-containing protein [Novosphingobium sp. KACC 22771]WDF74762.1 DUF1080 domain-containing protein [Novosphingobium sp. KACC 22771]